MRESRCQWICNRRLHSLAVLHAVGMLAVRDCLTSAKSHARPTWLGAIMALCGFYALHRGFTIDFSTHHITYLPLKHYPLIFDYIYAFCAIAPLMLYRSVYIRLYGLLALTGFVVSTAMFNPGRYSVWCFFAAVSSLVLYLFIQSQNTSAQRQLAEAVL